MSCLLWAVLALGLLGFGPPTLGSGDPFEPPVGSPQLAALAAQPQLAVTAAAAVLMDGGTGHVLLSHNADARLAPASLTKMMTALVAVERAPLGTPITATERSLSEPVIIGLDPGDSLPLEEMLYGMLLPSGNDAALAVAESVGGGSIDRFLGWMNERAVVMGLRNTHFMNPTGLDATGHYSSARDMGEIARVVLNEPTLARMVATPRYVVQGPPLYLFVNNNPLLGAYEGASGVKTGFTDEAGRTFAASAERNGEKLIAVLLNTPDLRAVGSGALDVGFALPRVTVEVARPGFARVQLNGGEQRGAPTRLAGWEAPFLRAMAINTDQGMQVRLLLAGRPLLRWTQ